VLSGCVLDYCTHCLIRQTRPSSCKALGKRIHRVHCDHIYQPNYQKINATMIKDENEAGTQGQGTPNQEGRNNHQGCNCHHHNRQHWNNNNNASGGKFRGKTKEIENNTFDNTGPHDAALFNKSLKNIANYFQLQHGNDISEAM
jgi:hypothetical protein